MIIFCTYQCSRHTRNTLVASILKEQIRIYLENSRRLWKCSWIYYKLYKADGLGVFPTDVCPSYFLNDTAAFLFIVSCFLGYYTHFIIIVPRTDLLPFDTSRVGLVPLDLMPGPLFANFSHFLLSRIPWLPGTQINLTFSPNRSFELSSKPERRG